MKGHNESFTWQKDEQLGIRSRKGGWARWRRGPSDVSYSSLERHRYGQSANTEHHSSTKTAHKSKGWAFGLNRGPLSHGVR